MSCEFWEISKDTFVTQHLRTTASGHSTSAYMVVRDINGNLALNGLNLRQGSTLIVEK